MGGDLGRLAHGGALNLIGAGIGAALGFAFTAVASRRLGAARAGAFFSLVALTTIAASDVAVDCTRLDCDRRFVRPFARAAATIPPT